MEDHKFSLSPLDHIMPRFYVVNLLYFPLVHPDIACIASKLKCSLQRTFEALPILSGTVQPAHQSEQSGSLCVSAPWNTIDDVFRVNHLTSRDLDYEDLRQNHFPMTTSKQHDLLSILYSRPDPLALVNPVMMAQVNFVRNGMILVQFLHHSFMDGLGGATVSELWATFCRGENGAEMISDEMMSRERLMLGDEAGRWEDVRAYVKGSAVSESGQRIPLVGSGAGFLGRAYNLATSIFNSLASFCKERLPGFQLPATGSRDISSGPQLQQEIETEIFFVSRSKLANLKSVVCASIASTVSSPSDGQSSSYISTNDALSALLFACVTEARKSIMSTNTQQTIPLALTVSGRRLLNPPLPDNYVGNMSLFSHLDLPLQSVTTEISDVATIAVQIRKRLLQLDDAYIKRLIGALRTVDDISKVAPAGRSFKKWYFIITSWTGQRFYSMDWGSEIGTKCERVRIPKLSQPTFDGVNIVLPELKVGGEEAGLEVVVGLEKRAMRRLKGMQEWTRWAQWRCS